MSSAGSIDPELFRSTYASVFDGDEQWRALPIPSGDRYAWDEASTYIANPPFFEGLTAEPAPLTDIAGARVLALLGDSVTTDHISPAGSIAAWSPAGQWLQAHGVGALDFNSYGARRGHHEVMMRGTFGNIRLRNGLAEGKEGPYTQHLPDGRGGVHLRRRHALPRRGRAADRDRRAASTARARRATGRPRAPRCSGVRAVLAESYERIHRSNLVGMGVLPLQFLPGEQRASRSGLTGREAYTITGLAELSPQQEVTVSARSDDDGSERTFRAIARLDGADRRRIPAPGGHPARGPAPAGERLSRRHREAPCSRQGASRQQDPRRPGRRNRTGRASLVAATRGPGAL